jgi:hypothetical protein
LPDDANKPRRMAQRPFYDASTGANLGLLSEGFSDRSNPDMDPQQYNSYYGRSLDY